MPHIELIIQHPSSGVSMPEAPRGKLYQAPPPPGPYLRRRLRDLSMLMLGFRWTVTYSKWLT